MSLIKDLQDKPRTWTKGPHFISTDPSLIPIATLNTWFASEEVYWALPMPEAAMRHTLYNSLCFGLYRQSESVQSIETSEHDTPPAPDPNTVGFVGFARCVTDTTTFIYLTDVFVLPSRQGLGLGSWLVSCVQEIIEDMPYLRRSMLFTSDWKRSVPFYEKVMGMHVLINTPPVSGEDGEGAAVMERKSWGFPGFEERSVGISELVD